ncbi:MAG: DUF2007 domain-containing protein [Geminicoccaceae bacterium]|nr:DUF2007 domain-containing protein [Geminicoccaceae bacterium]MCB9945030.1 DUF2007 domain-containing protein [Geminicoccaceae bacterium]
MVELFSSNDMVRLSWARAMLEAAGIDVLLLDEHMSALEGSIGAIPRRLLVPQSDRERAKAVLEDASGGEFNDIFVEKP